MAKESMIAARNWIPSRSTVFYVANLPGKGGVDWGYSEYRKDAIPLSPYWQRRFVADCRRAHATWWLLLERGL